MYFETVISPVNSQGVDINYFEIPTEINVILPFKIKNRSKFVAGDSNKFIAGPSQIVFALNPPYDRSR